MANHRLACSLCGKNCNRFGNPVSRVFKFVLFHFCGPCNTKRRAECDAMMKAVAS